MMMASQRRRHDRSVFPRAQPNGRAASLLPDTTRLISCQSLPAEDQRSLSGPGRTGERPRRCPRTTHTKRWPPS
jgi:hypothetical protein